MTMSYPHLASKLYNSPLLITPEKAEVIERVFRAHMEGNVTTLPPFEPATRADIFAQTATSFRRERAGYFRSESGVALIQVLGSLVQRGSGMDAMSGLESYDSIGAQLNAAVSDPAVRGILLEFDSPGGEANGVTALADAIRAANDQKPVVAHANEFAFSAAYWLASAAGELYVPKTGMVGSVGVIMLHVDQSQLNSKRGIEVTHIIAGARKADLSPHKPLSDRALASAQAMVDRLYGQFVDAVAGMRNISAKSVRDTEAALLNPDQAKQARMVDGIGTLGDALTRLETLMRDPSKRKKSYGQRAAASADFSLQEQQMSEEKKDGAAATTTATNEANARAEGVKEGKAAGVAEGVSAERARIAAILGCEEATGREAMASHLALKTATSPEDAKGLLAVAPKHAPKAGLGAAMPPNPKVGADAETDTRTKVASSAEIFSLRAKHAGHAK